MSSWNLFLWHRQTVLTYWLIFFFKVFPNFCTIINIKYPVISIFIPTSAYSLLRSYFLQEIALSCKLLVPLSSFFFFLFHGKWELRVKYFPHQNSILKKKKKKLLINSFLLCNSLKNEIIQIHQSKIVGFPRALF